MLCLRGNWKVKDSQVSRIQEALTRRGYGGYIACVVWEVDLRISTRFLSVKDHDSTNVIDVFSRTTGDL
jgi:hypothetical protein